MDQALEFLDPSAGQESDDSYPASIHGSLCGFPIPFLPRTEETEMEPGAGLFLTYRLINCRARGIPLSQIYLLHTVIINPRAPL